MHYTVAVAFSFLLSYILSLILQKMTHINMHEIKKIVLIIAHPDDEVMFFSPAIFSLQKVVNVYNFFLICITKGEFDDLPQVREKELAASCSHLGIPKENIIQLNNNDFPDHPKKLWNVNDLSEKIKSILDTLNIDTILTFGPGGVSGHINHKDTYAAVMKNKQFQRLILYDVNIFRKYLSAFDALCTCLIDGIILQKHVYISPPKSIYKAFKAMGCHKSQFVWFRKLYFLFSRYIIVNHVKIEPAEC